MSTQEMSAAEMSTEAMSTEVPGTTPASTAGPAAPAVPAPSSESSALGGPLEPEAVEALQNALSAEHAAIWSYGLISAYSPGDASMVQTNRTDHTFRRDATVSLLQEAGATPVQSLAAYHTPLDIVDVNSARELARIAEDDCANAWQAVLAATDRPEVRSFALSGLSDSSVRLALWREVGKMPPFIKAFPGQPKSE